MPAPEVIVFFMLRSSVKKHIPVMKVCRHLHLTDCSCVMFGIHGLLPRGGIQPRPDLFCEDCLQAMEFPDFFYRGFPDVLFSAIGTRRGNERIPESIAAAFTSTDLHISFLSFRFHF